MCEITKFMYTFLLFISIMLFVSSCSILKSCDCPGVKTTKLTYLK